MKTTILLILAAVLAAFAPTSVRAVDDIHVTYEEGRAAFLAGEFALAREKLALVLAKSPDHLPTRAMLAKIESQLGPDNTMLRKSYEKIILERVEFADVTLEEALQAVRMLSLKATQNKVAPNVIIKVPDDSKKTLSLNLAQVPLSEVLSYLAQLTGTRLVYDKTAVVITSIADVRPPPTPAATLTIPGINPPAPLGTMPKGTPTKHQAIKRSSVASSLDPFAPKS